MKFSDANRIFGQISINFWHRSFTFNSNKSPTWCNSFSVYYPDVCLHRNMFRTFSRPSSAAQWLQWQPLVLPSYRGDSNAMFVVGPAGPTAQWLQWQPLVLPSYRGDSNAVFVVGPAGLTAQWLQWQPLVLPSYRRDSNAVFVVGPAGPTTNTARLSPRYEGKIRGCHCSHWAPDDGWENARNMLSCKQTSG